MKLQVTKRSNEQKNEVKRLRRDGKIPAVIYGHDGKSATATVDRREFETCLRKIQKGHLSTTIFELEGEDGKNLKAIVKDIQYHVTTYAILHLDFEQLTDKVPVSIKVPIECQGVIDCVGVKLGGVLRTVMRQVKIRCLPKDIPACFWVDVKDLGMMETKRLKDIKIPETIKLMASTEDVAVIVAKR